MAGKLERKANQPVQVSPARAIQSKLVEYKPVIAKLLDGTGISEETFVAQIANACRAVPQLWQCTPESLLGAALRCAQLNLPPNDIRNLAWISPYKREATFQLGYGGIMELARRAVPGLTFTGHAVYPNDMFDVDYGSDRLIHKPAVAMQQDRGGDAYAWWVRGRYPDGQIVLEVLDRDRVEYHRRFSKQPDGQMWTQSYDAAALKSAVIEMKRWLPSSSQLVAAFASDEQVIDIDHIGPIEHQGLEDVEPERPRNDKGRFIAASETEPPADDPEDQADAEWVAEAQEDMTDC